MTEAHKILNSLQLKLSAADPCKESVDMFWQKCQEEKDVVKILLDEYASSTYFV